MKQNENKWDKKLKISTVGRDATAEDENHFPYEPTPYCVLERLAESGELTKDNVVVDYGCGKGRVSFFLSGQVGCKSIGIEYDPKMYEMAKINRERYIHKERVCFNMQAAEEYDVVCEADSFFFFNPFSVKLLQKVIGKIQMSFYEMPRQIKLYFYYPSSEYISYLMTEPELEFYDEINCSDLFEENQSRERIVIFVLE